MHKLGKLPPLETILSAIDNQTAEKNAKRAKNEFVAEWPHPATWINGERWHDECELEKPAQVITPPTWRKTECRECNQSALLRYYEKIEGTDQWIEKSCICGVCDNWRKFFPSIEDKKRSTKAELTKSGFIVYGSRAFEDLQKRRRKKKVVVKNG